MYQAANLVSGRFQVACTACDNVVAYQEGAGEVDLDREPDLFMIMGATQIEVSFVVRPEIKSYEDIRGQKLALDALATGFAFALYRMLDEAGLSSAMRTSVVFSAALMKRSPVGSSRMVSSSGSKP